MGWDSALIFIKEENFEKKSRISTEIYYKLKRPSEDGLLQWVGIVPLFL